MKSQNDLIAEYLKQGNTLTPIDALNRFGCFRLSGRIHDLKRSGLPIEARTVENNGKRYAEYRIAKKQTDLFQ